MLDENAHVLLLEYDQSQILQMGHSIRLTLVQLKTVLHRRPDLNPPHLYKKSINTILRSSESEYFPNLQTHNTLFLSK